MRKKKENEMGKKKENEMVEKMGKMKEEEKEGKRIGKSIKEQRVEWRKKEKSW